MDSKQERTYKLLSSFQAKCQCWWRELANWKKKKNAKQYCTIRQRTPLPHHPCIWGQQQKRLRALYKKVKGLGKVKVHIPDQRMGDKSNVGSREQAEEQSLSS